VAQCIVIGPVCVFVGVFVMAGWAGGWAVSVTMITRKCMHWSSPN